jgi:hypothetical protein
MVFNHDCAVYAKVLLIGGTGRSGTNLLKDIFTKRFDVYALPFESRFTVDPDGLCVTYRTLKHCWSPGIAEQAIDRFSKFMNTLSRRTFTDRACIAFQKCFRLKGNIRPYKEWELDNWFSDFSHFTDAFIRCLKSFSYRGGIWPGDNSWLGLNNKTVYDHTELYYFRKYLNNLYLDTLRKQGKSLYVDDNTFNILHASTLQKLLPYSVFVHVVRDPRDVISSYMRQRWTPHDLDKAVSYYNLVMSAWDKQKCLINKRRYVEVRFEDLCMYPESTLKRICGALGLSIEKNMLDISIDESFIGKWKRDLNRDQQEHLNKTVQGKVNLYYAR